MVLSRWILAYSWQPCKERKVSEWYQKCCRLPLELISSGGKGEVAELQFLDSEKRGQSFRHCQLETGAGVFHHRIFPTFAPPENAGEAAA